LGGDALNKVPDRCVIDVDVRYLPEQEPRSILNEVAAVDGVEIASTFNRPPAEVDPESTFVRALCDAAAPFHAGELRRVGRDGASDAVSFLRAGVPGRRVRPRRRGTTTVPRSGYRWLPSGATGRRSARFVEILPSRVGDGEGAR